MLNFSHVSLSVPSHEKPILDGLNCTIHKGEFVVILGANGSGKSSFLKLISGEYPSSKGTITNKSTQLAHLSQDTADTLFHDLTVLENCCLSSQKIKSTPFKISTAEDQSYYQTYLKQCHKELPSKMNTITGKLSGGERQSLALGLILNQNPDLLLLDEHTSALDPKTAAVVMELTHQVVTDRRLTTIMVTHNLKQAIDYGSRLIALKDGKIIIDCLKKDLPPLTEKKLSEIYC